METITVNADPMAQILRDLLLQSPSLLACLIGCILTLTFREKLRGGAFPAFSGFALALVMSLTSPVLWAFLPPKIYEINPDLMDVATFAIAAIQNFLWALIFLLLGLGIFLGRVQPAPHFVASSRQ